MNLAIAVVGGLLVGALPKVGDVIADFTVSDTDGNKHRLSEMLKSGPVIVAFFPEAFTPGCTREFTAYRDRHADILKANAQILAVSMDAGQTLRKFKQSLNASYPFVSDPEGRLVKKFGVKAPGRGIATRHTFVIGEGRRVLHVDSGPDAIDVGKAIASCPVAAPSERRGLPER